MEDLAQLTSRSLLQVLRILSWLRVGHPEAKESRDYELDKLMPFWPLTSEQDWELCEYAQTGISFSFYQPGVYSTHKEYNVDAFVRWYLEALRQ